MTISIEQNTQVVISEPIEKLKLIRDELNRLIENIEYDNYRKHKVRIHDDNWTLIFSNDRE